MSKCVKSIPLSRVERISVVFGEGRSLSQIKAAVGCDCIVNGGLYDLDRGKPVCHLKADGTVCARESWGDWGYAWDSGADIAMRQVPKEAEGKASYITCFALLTPCDGIGAKLNYGAALGGSRGRTAMAVGGGKLILYCSGDGTPDGSTPEGLRAELYGMGAETAIMLDGGGSSQCDLGGRAVIRSSRRVNNYICVWLKTTAKEDKPVGKYRVTAGTGLNIRSGPNKSANRVGGYNCGDVVTVYETKSGWARTERGWVSMDYLSPAGADSTHAETPDKPWYADAQAWAVAQGISDGSRPTDAVTRAEVWTMLQRLEGK